MSSNNSRGIQYHDYIVITKNDNGRLQCWCSTSIQGWSQYHFNSANLGLKFQFQTSIQMFLNAFQWGELEFQFISRIDWIEMELSPALYSIAEQK